MALKKFIKDPDAVLDYTIDWAKWLEPAGDTISNATATATGNLSVDSVSHTTTTTTVWLSGGDVDTVHEVTVHIETNGGREDDRTIQIAVKEL